MFTFFGKDERTYSSSIKKYESPSNLSAEQIANYLIELAKSKCPEIHVGGLLAAYDVVHFRYLEYARAASRKKETLPFIYTGSPDGYCAYLGRLAGQCFALSYQKISVDKSTYKNLVRNEYLYLAVLLKSLHLRAKTDKAAYDLSVEVWLSIIDAPHRIDDEVANAIARDHDEYEILEPFVNRLLDEIQELIPTQVKLNPKIYPRLHSDLPQDICEDLRRGELSWGMFEKHTDCLPTPDEDRPAKSVTELP